MEEQLQETTQGRPGSAIDAKYTYGPLQERRLSSLYFESLSKFEQRCIIRQMDR